MIGRASTRTVLGVMLAGALGVRCSAAQPAPSLARAGAGAPDERRVTSNILRADYAGSRLCRCHADMFDAWRRSPMHNMTRDPAAAAIRAPFDGATFSFKDDTAR